MALTENSFGAEETIHGNALSSAAGDDAAKRSWMLPGAATRNTEGGSGTRSADAEVEQILVFGNIQLTTAAIASYLEAQVPVLFLSQTGAYKGHLWSAEQGSLAAEFAQFSRHSDASFQLETARAIVLGKLGNSRQLLLRLNRKRKLDPIATAIGKSTARCGGMSNCALP